jgi:hypothetical protein
MPDPEKKREVRRIRALLQKMSEVAEHAEQTGSFESAIHNYVKRYNAIVGQLEDIEAIPEDVFPKLDEDEADFGQLGGETKLLADYLDDIMEETPVENPNKKEKEKSGRFDAGVLVALAPFLGSNELSKLVRQHFDREPQAEEKKENKEPDLKTLVGLAPFVDKATLGKLVRNALSRQPLTDPGMLVALAPHLDSEELSQILREQFPEWFGEGAPKAPDAPDAPAAPPKPPTPPEGPGAWLQSLSAARSQLERRGE